ncbi:MAG: hypothetical protein LBN34_10005 [Clostridiales Family XIII bacterium]|jgi:hypothetical protein|nr:hypothetical protein [Clostridiales Family XIII bacterium]
MKENNTMLALSKSSAKTNCIVVILLVTLLLALLTPLAAAPAYAQEDDVPTYLYVPPNVDDPITIMFQTGKRFILQILDYNSKYLDATSGLENNGEKLTVRELLFGSDGDDDALLSWAEYLTDLTIDGDLDAEIFDWLDKAIAANAANEGSLSKVNINSTSDIPQAEIDFWKSSNVTPEIKDLLAKIDFVFTLPNTKINHTYVDLLDSLEPKSITVNWIGEPDEPEILVVSDFGTWKGAGTATAEVDGADAQLESFSELRLNGNIIDPSNYDLASGSTIITLHEDYLKTFANGNYTFEAAFEVGFAPLALVVDVPPAQIETAQPRTGDNAQTALLLTLLLSSIAILIFVQAKRKAHKPS